ncbi:MAG: DoxX family protein [Lentimicrobium sp.]|nr:DoxX family protein [Lentimicrobium sp.]
MLKKLLITSPSGLTDLALLILRLSVGLLMLTHGIPKFLNFGEIVESGKFLPVLGSVTFGLSLAIFAEIFMSLLLIAGFLTRLSVMPLIITMLIAAFVAHGGDSFSAKEPALLYLFSYISILLAGPGRFSVDRMIEKMIK